MKPALLWLAALALAVTLHAAALSSLPIVDRGGDGGGDAGAGGAILTLALATGRADGAEADAAEPGAAPASSPPGDAEPLPRPPPVEAPDRPSSAVIATTPPPRPAAPASPPPGDAEPWPRPPPAEAPDRPSSAVIATTPPPRPAAPASPPTVPTAGPPAEPVPETASEAVSTDTVDPSAIGATARRPPLPPAVPTGFRRPATPPPPTAPATDAAGPAPIAPAAAAVPTDADLAPDGSGRDVGRMADGAASDVPGAGGAAGGSAASEGGGGSAAAAPGLADYLSAVAAHLDRVHRYPPQARSRNLRGTARYVLTIAADGTLIERRRVTSAGHPWLDRAAEATLDRASPFPPLPPEHGDRLTITVPLRFELR